MTSPRTLTQRHRAQQLLLRRATVAQVAKLWPALDWASLDASYPNFALSVAALVQRNRQTSAGLAAQYLRAFRLASGVPGELNIVHAEPLIVDQFTNALYADLALAMPFSTAVKFDLSHTCTLSMRGSGADTVATWLSGIIEP